MKHVAPAASRAASAALLSLLAACGSTVSLPPALGSISGDGGAASVNSGLGPPGSAPASGGSTAVQMGSGGDARGGAAPVGSVSRSGDVPRVGNGPTVNGNGPGITPKTIKIGIRYATNMAAYQAALGNTTATGGDPYAYEQIVVKDINDHGGINGRTLVPVYHADDANSTATAAEQDQAACAAFTQDDHVFAALPGSSYDSPFNSCMTKAGSVIGGSTATGMTTHQYNQFPNMFDVTGLSLDRLSLNLVNTLARQKYFTPWDTSKGAPAATPVPVKVGVIAPDQTSYRSAVTHVLLPQLAAQGYAVDQSNTYFYAVPNSNSDDAKTIADIQSAVLRFRSAGVTHVLPLELNAQVFFARQAENQQYRPRYGIQSASGSALFAGTLVPYAQLNGAVGFGWVPTEDLPSDLNPDNGPYSSSARRYCITLMKRHGQSFDSTNAEATALIVCDLLFTMRNVIARIPEGSAINQQTFSQALDHYGSFSSANLPVAQFAAGRRDGASVAWVWKYFTSCQCLHYEGPQFHLA